jgi:pimeloyl-ACP methyl ester carboxylesterase
MNAALSSLHVREVGAGRPHLLLLHGLGATGDVWDGMLASAADRWPGRVVAPDLPGHGRSAPLERYSFDALAAEVAQTLDPDDGFVVLGHSLGGVVGLVLAGARLGAEPAVVIGLGIKVAWSEDELGRAAALAAKESQVFERREDALARHLRVSGLEGLVDAGHAAAVGGVRDVAGGYRIALDNAAFGVGAPDMAGLLAAARCPVTLARGELDPLNTDEQLRALVPEPVTLPGLGHNAHVEDPAAVWDLLERSAHAGR